ncbi:MAG: ribonuclease H-like domain-containing protein [Deltaproteobacteria bacterium]|nr:ribonuclease H-like domain-containing protein [Deltaproteobacteria bacterium]
MGKTAKSYLVLDIETVPDVTLWGTRDTPLGHERPFPPTYAHRVVVVGCMWLDEGYRMRRLGVVGDQDDEPSILHGISEFIDKNRPALVTFNGRTFDLPVLALRSLHCGVPMGWYYQERGLRYRYSEEGHIDLCDWLADHGAAKSSSLDSLARLIGLPGKLGVDGSQIEGLYRTGQLETIRNYCLADVAQTALLFLRFRLLQGVLSPDDYQRAASELVAELRADDRLTALTSAIDGDRVLHAA